MPATTKKPIKIVPNTIKTIPKVPLSPISKSKSFQEKLNDIQNNIDINIDDIPEDLLDIWDELQEDITPKLISKNYKLWLTIFTPFILPGIINGMSGKPAVPQPVVTVQEPAPDPKQIVNFAQKYFAEHGLELCKSLTKTDLNSMKQDLINNWGKGPDAFSKTFQDSYPVSKSRLENIYRSERHLAEYNGVLERAKIADHKYKQWRAVGDERSCDLCMSYDMETVPINEPFSNGEMTAMGHPQCRCSMVTYSDEDYNEMKEDSAYLDDVVNTIKLNYNCPDSEKIGSGPGSCGGNKPNEKHEPEKPTNIATTKNKKIASFISNALQEDPRRMFHGYIPKKGKLLTTNDTGFWLDSEGKSYVHKKLVDIPENKRNDLINVHSHAGQDREQLIVNKKDVADFEGIESFSGGDFQMLQFNIKNGYGRKIAVIVAPDEYDYFEVPEEKLGEFIKIKDIANKFEAHSSSLEESRKFLMEISNKNGFIYRPAIKFEQKQDSSYLANAFETIKFNYNCPDDEKIGSGPGSCSGGNTSNLDKVSTLKNKIRELEKSVSEGKSTFDEAYEQYKSIQKELDLELEKEKLRNPDNAKITNDIVTDPEPITPYKALSDYQNYAYTAINDYLRKTNYVKQNPQQTKNIQNMIKTIDSEMENNPLKSDKLVFRADSAGISSEAFEKTGLTNIFKDTFGKERLTLEDFIKNHKLIDDKIREKLVGYEYTEKAYLSTGSDKENTMNRFLAPSRDISKYGVTGLINLIVPKGTPAIRIADYTGLEDELGGKIDEYLIGRDQTIVIDQVYIRPADDDRLYLEYNAHIKTNEQKQNSAYLADATNFIKLNYNCPDSEKNGSGPGSCGGSSDTKKEIFDNFKYEMDAFFKIPAQIADSKLIQYNQNISKHPENIRLEGMRLIHRTGSNNYQKEAREQIISEITNNTQLGKYLNDKIMAETKAFEENPVRLYRSGKYKNSIIESFTSNPDSAFTTNFDDVPPGNDFHKDYDELKTDGWKVLSGVLQSARYPEEYEVTLINIDELNKYRNKQKQNSAYLEDVSDFIKLNYKCKAGTVGDSNKCDPNNNTASENTKFEGIKKYLQPVDDVVAKTMHDNELSFYSSLKPSEKNVIDHWASKQKQANKYLFTGIGPGKQTVKIIDNMIKKSVVPINITSYSGIPGHRVKQLVGEFDVGDEFQFNGFMSTSLDFSFSSIFGASEGGCILKIETPKGTNGIYIEKNKENKITEHEVVLDRGQSWIVNEVEKYDGITIVSIKRK